MDITCTYYSHCFKDTYIATFIHILAIYSYVHVYVCVCMRVCVCVHVCVFCWWRKIDGKYLGLLTNRYYLHTGVHT